MLEKTVLAIHLFLCAEDPMVAFPVSEDAYTAMIAEEVICKILLECPGVTKEQIIERFDGVKKKTGGLISDDVLLRMVAAELGCILSDEGALTPLPSFADLIPGLEKITIIGRVVAVFPSRKFKGIRKGKFASLLLSDRSGLLRAVLWNEKADMMESGVLKIGQVVRFAHGYTRENKDGFVELHVGENCKIDIDPQDVNTRNYPAIRKFNAKISDLPDLGKNGRTNLKVNIAGTIKDPSTISAFQRKDSTSGKVMRFELVDATGSIIVVVWNEKAEELQQILKNCSKLQIVSAKLREGLDRGFEVHVDAETYLEPLLRDQSFSKIADLKDGMTEINVKGKVAGKPVLRIVKTSAGETIELAVFELKDDTGAIWVSAWRQHAPYAKALTVGKQVALNNVYVKKGFGEKLEICTRCATSIEIG